MTIHYNGDVSKRPGKQACKQRGAIDFAQQWTPVDCTQCKITLLGMPVVQLDDTSVHGIIADVTSDDVLVEVPAELARAVDEPVPAFGRLTFEAFEQAWRRDL